MRGARASQQDHDGNTCLDIAKLHGDTEFAAHVDLATRVDPGGASLAFGPGEFDIVKNTETMTDEREITAAIISEVCQLGKASAEELDRGVLTMEQEGAHRTAMVLGVSYYDSHVPPLRVALYAVPSRQILSPPAAFLVPRDDGDAGRGLNFPSGYQPTAAT
jgi:hypothetical protein